MSSSSGPDPRPATPHLEIAEIEQTEGLLEQRRPKSEAALGAKAAAEARGRTAFATAGYAAPGTLWLLFFLLAPVVFIVLVSFWHRTISGFDSSIWTLDNYRLLFQSSTYWENLRKTFQNSLLVTGACLLLGFPIAYFLAITIKNLRNQIALFIIALAPFWTSSIIRAEAWVPTMGLQGAINSILQKIGLIDRPVSWLLFSNFSVVVAMIQLYILFMITPLFFMLAQIDKASLESARDLGANWFKTFREVTLPQSMPGIIIGSIFVFVLTMGDFGTVSITGGGRVSSVGILVSTYVTTVEFPQAAASAALLVVAMVIGVFVLLRFSNLREDLGRASSGTGGGLVVESRKVRWGLGAYFVLFLLFLYGPMIVMTVISLQGQFASVSFPLKGFSFHWWSALWNGTHAADIKRTAGTSLRLGAVSGAIVALLALLLSMAYRRRFRGDGALFYLVILALMTPGILLSLGTSLFWQFIGTSPSLWTTALGTNVVWGLPFAFLVMIAVWNRYDRTVEEAARDLGAGVARTFREITLPLIWTGIFSAFIFGFTLSWNEFDRTALVIGSGENTLPVQIVALIQGSVIQPDLFALGTATTLFSLLVIALFLLVAAIWLRIRAGGVAATTTGPGPPTLAGPGRVAGLARIGARGK